MRGILENEPKGVSLVTNDVHGVEKTIPLSDFTVSHNADRASDYTISIPLKDFLHSNISKVLISADKGKAA
jgi:hypothetical protein